MNTLSEELLWDVAYSLDRVKGNVEYWRLLIPMLPKNMYPYNKIDIEKIAFVGITGKGSPSLEILRDFQRKGMEVSYFKNMLQIIECQGALDCFNEPSKFYKKVKYFDTILYTYSKACCTCTSTVSNS